ncbi:phytase [Streptomyces viridochromogenes]|uniref:phytase n=1 Tax=Streptomyces viridochromogenes TaxID=1938 RepID=UPI00069D3DC1|nr:phytase [Streptomyces viridochromogenes]KOG18004.1 hydrolase [Streptomyces viridochromogenes]KOG18725.1 hydrolase [Streptomyces viridochromogenes]
MSASALSTLTAALLMVTGASAPQPVSVSARVETPAVHDDEAGGNADADDPALWVDPRDPGRSLVIGTLKEAGLDVYGLDGTRLQHIAAPAAPGEDAAPGRFNNVDVVYGFELGGRKTDLALVSDRGRDRVRAYAIDPAAVAAGRPPLKDVTAADAAPVFSASEAEVDDQRTAYGLAAFSDDDNAYAVVSRRSETRVRLLRLEDRDGRVGYATEDTLDLPASFTLPNGQSWTPCADPGDHAQVEGMVVDQEEHVLYAAQEDVGLWRVDLDDEEFDRPRLIDRVREYGTPWTYDAEEEECVIDTAHDPGFGGEHLSADAEGAAIYHAADGKGYLLASSQGDNTFAVYERQGRNAYLGSFAIADSAATDGVQHSDGAAVVNVPLGRSFPKGLLITHDGEATPADGDREGTNFKFTGWESVAGAFPKPLTIDTRSFDPRATD